MQKDRESLADMAQAANASRKHWKRWRLGTTNYLIPHFPEFLIHIYVLEIVLYNYY